MCRKFTMLVRQGRQSRGTVSRDQERQELATLLSHPTIARSANMVRMLTYICEKYFEGRVEDIRESCIAVHALGRRESSFDSHADPIVRVTARMLRKRLDTFYSSEGRNRALKLELPLGRYVPQFVHTVRSSVSLEDGWPAHSENALDSEGADPSALPVIAKAGALIGHASHGEIPASGIQRLHSTGKRALVGSIVAAAFVLACAISFFAGRKAATVRIEPAAHATFWGNPVWSDEFNGAAGARPDPSVWSFDTGDNNGWGNNEVQVYCAAGSNVPPCDASHPNVYQDGLGHLVLRAIRTPSGAWTSARIHTVGHKEFQYGRIEARMKLPAGAGLWPAFWMIGSQCGTSGWPQCGSVDLVENVSNPKNPTSLGPSAIRSTIHGPGYSLGNGLYQNYLLSYGGHIEEFHVYGAIWSTNMIQFYVDDPANVFFVRTASDVPAGARWVLNHPFNLVANLAVGGIWPGAPDETTSSPSDVLIDYVRVYRAPQIRGPAMTAKPVVLSAGKTGSTVLSLSAKNNTRRVYLACSGAPANTSCSLATPVVNFTSQSKQDVPVAIATASIAGAQRFAAPMGDYVLTVTAYTVSGDTSFATIPLRVH